MATTNLMLKRPTADSTRVVCLIRDGKGVYLKLYTRVSLKPKHWSKSKQIVLSANPNAGVYNRYLKAFKKKALDIYLSAQSEGIVPSGEYIRQEMKPKPVKIKDGFWEVWDKYIQAKSGYFSIASHKKFNTIKNHLKNFESESSTKLVLDTIDISLFESLQIWFYNSAELKTQTTAKYIKVFKMFLNWAYTNKFTENSCFQNFKPISQPEGIKVILTDKELNAVRNYSAKGYLYNAKQLFLLSCLTGLRYSDYSRIKPYHLKKDHDGLYSLDIRQQKTDDLVSIPLTEESEKIVKQLLTGKVRPITNQRMNVYVKELCRLAGINESFEIHEYKGKEKTSKICPKFELITTHTGRRTFATNLLIKGVPERIVMMYTGHKDYKSFSSYINIPDIVRVNAVRNALAC